MKKMLMLALTGALIVFALTLGAAQAKAGAVANATSPELVAYLKSIEGDLAGLAEYPREARVGSHEGAVTLAITLDRSGVLRSASVVSSSGPEVFEREALRAVRRASFTPVPKALGEQTLTIKVPFVFALAE
jgi:protein TonB